MLVKLSLKMLKVVKVKCDERILYDEREIANKFQLKRLVEFVN